MRYMILLGMIATLCGGCWEKTAPPASPSPPIDVIAVKLEKRWIPIYAKYVGHTEASLFVEIRARVSGILEKIEFEEGTMVDVDTPLYVIDPKPYEAARDRATAELERAQAAAAKAERDEARLRPLHKEGAASQLDYDDSVTAVESSKADIEIAKANLAEAKLELSYTQIKSPLKGYIGESKADIGAVVGSSGKTLLNTVQDLDPIRIRFNMTSRDYITTKRERQKKGEQQTESTRMVGTIKVVLPDGQRYEHGGEVDFSAPEINPTTGTFSVRARLANPDRVLLPGMPVGVRLLERWLHAILVPQRALQVEQGGAFVWVVTKDSTAERRFVLTSSRFHGQEVIVESGLEAGEVVIVEGIHKLRQDAPVRIVEPGSTSTREVGSGD